MLQFPQSLSNHCNILMTFGLQYMYITCVHRYYNTALVVTVWMYAGDGHTMIFRLKMYFSICVILHWQITDDDDDDKE